MFHPRLTSKPTHARLSASTDVNGPPGCPSKAYSAFQFARQRRNQLHAWPEPDGGLYRLWGARLRCAGLRFSSSNRQESLGTSGTGESIGIQTRPELQERRV